MNDSEQCPHDGVCPLHHPGSSRLVCGFSQRLQRPAFVRLTKHSGVGHEDIEYSYVVVRRGTRPVAGNIKVGRVGEVGKRDMYNEVMSQAPVKELKLHGDHDEAHSKDAECPSMPAAAGSIDVADEDGEPLSHEELDAALRLEAFGWPRLVFPPLKKSGHVILDSCTAEGEFYVQKQFKCALSKPHLQGKSCVSRFRSLKANNLTMTHGNQAGVISFRTSQKIPRKNAINHYERRVKAGQHQLKEPISAKGVDQIKPRRD
jgi:hypothetical protein